MPLGGIPAVLAKLRAIEESVLNDLGDDIVKAARAKAPVRKLYKQKRRKYKTLSGANLEVRRAVRALEGLYGSNRSKYQAKRYELLYGGGYRVKVRRPGNRNKPLKIGGIRTISMKVKGELGTTNLVSVDKFFSARGVGAREHSRGEVRDFYNKDPKTGFIQPIKPQSGYTTNERVDAQLSPRGRYEVRSGRATVTSEEGRIQIGGRLKKSIVARGTEASDTKSGMTNRIGTDVEYAIYVEFPTSHNGAQPFLLPALHDQARYLKPRLEEAFKQAGLKKG